MSSKPDLESLEARLQSAIVAEFESHGEAWTTDHSGDLLAWVAAGVAVRLVAPLLKPGDPDA